MTQRIVAVNGKVEGVSVAVPHRFYLSNKEQYHFMKRATKIFSKNSENRYTLIFTRPQRCAEDAKEAPSRRFSACKTKGATSSFSLEAAPS